MKQTYILENIYTDFFSHQQWEKYNWTVKKGFEQGKNYKPLYSLWTATFEGWGTQP